MRKAENWEDWGKRVQIGKYKVTHYLGGGAMGVVFRALDPSDRPYAIKMIGSRAAIQAAIRASLGVNETLQNAAALDLNRRMMLVREARLAMELKHPNIIKTFDYGQHGGLLYIVVEYLQGRSLAKVLPIHGAVPLSTKVKMIRQLCDALEYAHSHGVMHRDVKPANTFVLLDGSVKVLDFGLAARLREPLSGEVAVGTPYYVAPEVIAGSHVYDARVDIWSTGVTLYQLLTGSPPFFAPLLSQLFTAIIHAPYPRLDPQFPHARELERILDLALAKDPLARYATAADFARDLRRLEEETAERPLSPAGNSRAAGEDPWWASTVAQLPASPSMELDKPSETVSMISGYIRARRGNHTVRFLQYNTKAFPLLAMGIVIAGYPALIMIIFYVVLASPHIRAVASVMSAFSVDRTFPIGLLLVIGFPFYGVGLAISVAVAISIGLGLLAFREKFSEIPHCRNCKTWMKHLSRIDRFSYTENSRAHASSDCLAALKENLWEDAAKLLSMHGELFSPKTKTDLPLIRYYLDFYACRLCGAEIAMLTTEDGVGGVLKPREEYAGAYKVKSGVATKQSLVQQWLQFREAMKRAATLAAESIDHRAALLVLTAALFLGIYYYPVVPPLLGILTLKAPITIKSDPLGQAVLVDGIPVITPKTFFWSYDSVHTIAGITDRQINGHLYNFQELIANPSDPSRGGRFICGISKPPRPTECTVTVTEEHDAGQRVAHPLIGSYTVVFSTIPTSTQVGKKPSAIQSR